MFSYKIAYKGILIQEDYVKTFKVSYNIIDATSIVYFIFVILNCSMTLIVPRYTLCVENGYVGSIVGASFIHFLFLFPKNLPTLIPGKKGKKFISSEGIC